MHLRDAHGFYSEPEEEGLDEYEKALFTNETRSLYSLTIGAGNGSGSQSIYLILLSVPRF